MKIYFRLLQNGTKCYIIYKSGYKMTRAAFSVNFGSADSGVIPGCAHFLEHKVFEQKEGNVFEAFSENSADVNAYTNFNTTAYYFDCSEKFEKNLEILLNFTSNPYLTCENVEKEKGIIKEEIKMYEDDPWWQVYFNLLKCLYTENPVRNNIAGDCSDIEKINRDILCECYNKYYCGENSALVICGDVDAEKTFGLADSLISLKRGEKKENKPFKADKINSRLNKVKMEVSKPLFNFGFREINFNLTSAERLCESRLLLDIIGGRSSLLYERLYLNGLIDRDFSMEYLLGNDFGSLIFSGISHRPEGVAEEVLKAAKNLRLKGIKAEALEKSRKKLISAFIRGLNSLDGLSSAQTDYAFKGLEFSDIYNKYLNITKDPE
ncbi:MAG: insulinase family protein [Clostridiales bacterium]|nr:insulinase family protein [Clostridiales bacterium]